MKTFKTLNNNSLRVSLLSGNKYIATFVDWYSGWLEAYPIPDKKGETTAHLLIEEKVPRYGSCLQ